MDDTHKDLIEDIEEAAKAPAKRRGTSIKPTVEKLTTSLYENGALPDDLIRLIGLVTHPSHLDQASLAAIIRNLYPATKVPNAALLQVLGCLGHGQLKPSLTIQSHLLRWLVMVYHVLEELETLSRAYAVLFNLLDTAAIRPQLCHILALITRRKHVRPYRIQAVLELSRQTGGEPALTGLLRVFKNYYPEIIVGTAIRGRAAAFKHPDASWRERLDEIQEEYRSKSRLEVSGPRDGFRVNHLLGKQMKGQKSKLPGVHTLHAQESSITLEEIDNADSFVRNLEKIELPSQLVAVLADPLLQKLMILRPDNEASIRVRNWVNACITDVRTGDADASVLLDVVEVLQDYVAATKSLPPTLLRIFQELFKVWNGVDSQDAVLNVLTHVPPTDFEALYSSTLQPLENAILSSTPSTPTAQLTLLKFYTTLLTNWSTALLSTPSPSLPTLHLPSLTRVTTHIHTLTETLTQTYPSVKTHLYILNFLTLTAALTTTTPLLQYMELTIPSANLIYILHFSPSLTVLSRLCDIITTYKHGLESIMPGRSSQRPLSPAESSHVKIFNGFLMDICNCVWRTKAFSTSDTNAQGCYVHPDVTEALAGYMASIDQHVPLTSAFGLSAGPVFVRWALEYIREVEDGELAEGKELRERHRGLVTQKSLSVLRARGGVELSWQEYRLGMLEHLEGKGFGGLGRLMYNTMKILMGGKGGTSQSQSQSQG